MTTSVRRPRLADTGIGHLLVAAAILATFDPPVGSIVENCRCEYACASRWTAHGGKVHLGFWVQQQTRNAWGHPVGVTYWTYVCLFGCTPDPSIGGHQEQ